MMNGDSIELGDFTRIEPTNTVSSKETTIDFYCTLLFYYSSIFDVYMYYNLMVSISVDKWIVVAK